MADRKRTSEGGIYHIRVKGQLDDKWGDWFEGFVMASRDNGETLLTGSVADQAALHGALSKIHGLGLPLLLVRRSDCPCSSKRCPRRGRCQECAAYHRARGKQPYCLQTKTKWDRHCLASASGK
jgi:hypothetical protein